MKKCSWIGSILVGFGLLMAWAPNLAVAAEDPITMLKSVSDQMIAHLKKNQASIKANPSLVYSLATHILVPHADLEEMSKRVLPPQIWNKATPAQRQAFKSEFSTVLVRTYASALADYSDETIRFFPIRGGYEGKASVKVNSEIVRSDGPVIPVNYSLVLRGVEWKVYDMVVEGISMLESFRSQFADKLSQGDMASLIAALKQHNTNNAKGTG